jgi:hypothetical protein
MKTTLEIPDSLFRKVKATAALDGQSLKDFITDAVKEKLTRPARNRKEGWQTVFGKLPAKAAREMRAITTDPEFRKIEPEDWQ